MSDEQSQLRRIFMVFYDGGIQFAIWVDNVESKRVPTLFGDVTGALNAQSDDPSELITYEASECDFYGWEFEALPVDTTVAQVPEPGVVFAVRASQEDFGSGTSAMRLGIRWSLTKDDTYGPRVKRFLRSPDATREAAPLLRYDAFISHSALDAPFAAAFVGELRRLDVTCFLAEITLTAGRLWADELRGALLSSRVGVILLTPKSVASAWVHAEVGAMWALRRRVVPVLVGLTPDDVPSSLVDLLPTCVAVPERMQAEPTLVQELASRLAATLATLETTPEPRDA